MYKYIYIYLVHKKVGYSWEYQEYPLYPPMIIAKVYCNKMGRRHAGTEASSRPVPYLYRGLF